MSKEILGILIFFRYLRSVGSNVKDAAGGNIVYCVLLTKILYSKTHAEKTTRQDDNQII